jgi:hypothetical protein
MATPLQITANQLNAQRSTGPTSIEGKARVAQNAVKHGLTSIHLVVRDDEREDFETMRDALVTELDPQGAVETITFNDLLHAAWNLERFRRIEAESSKGEFLDCWDPINAPALERLARYQSRAQRQYYRALKELRILQTNRALRQVKLDEEKAKEVPAITDINNLTKQTRSEVLSEAIDQAIKLVEAETGAMQLKSMHTGQVKVAQALPPAKRQPAKSALDAFAALPPACRL